MAIIDLLKIADYLTIPLGLTAITLTLIRWMSLPRALLFVFFGGVGLGMVSSYVYPFLPSGFPLWWVVSVGLAPVLWSWAKRATREDWALLAIVLIFCGRYIFDPARNWDDMGQWNPKPSPGP